MSLYLTFLLLFLGLGRRRAAPRSPQPAIQAVPGESPFCQGLVFAVEKLCLAVRIILIHRECEVYTAARTANYKPIRFIESVPNPRVWSIQARANRRDSPFIIRRILG
jgi:hypothetical protein